MVREYNKVTNEARKTLVRLIREGMQIKEAAQTTDIKYENAKAIVRIFKNELRIEKRKNRFRYKLGEDKNMIKRNKLNFLTNSESHSLTRVNRSPNSISDADLNDRSQTDHQNQEMAG
jgi:predicted  nucleic acid-binding Zn-ribbon protein